MYIYIYYFILYYIRRAILTKKKWSNSLKNMPFIHYNIYNTLQRSHCFVYGKSNGSAVSKKYHFTTPILNVK